MLLWELTSDCQGMKENFLLSLNEIEVRIIKITRVLTACYIDVLTEVI